MRLRKEQLEADLQIGDSFLKAEYIKTSVKSYSHSSNVIFPSQNCDIQIQCNYNFTLESDISALRKKKLEAEIRIGLFLTLVYKGVSQSNLYLSRLYDFYFKFHFQFQ